MRTAAGSHDRIPAPLALCHAQLESTIADPHPGSRRHAACGRDCVVRTGNQETGACSLPSLRVVSGTFTRMRRMEEARRLEKPRVQGTSAASGLRRLRGPSKPQRAKRSAQTASEHLFRRRGGSERTPLRGSGGGSGPGLQGPYARKGEEEPENMERGREREIRREQREDTQREGAACYGAGGRVSSALAQTIAAEGKVGSMIW